LQQRSPTFVSRSLARTLSPGPPSVALDCLPRRARWGHPWAPPARGNMKSLPHKALDYLRGHVSTPCVATALFCFVVQAPADGPESHSRCPAAGAACALAQASVSASANVAARRPGPETKATPRVDFPQERLATDSWVYEELEKLVLVGALDQSFLDTRPLSRADIAAALAKAQESDRSLSSNPVAQRLLREFAWELEQMKLPSPFDNTAPLITFGDEASFLRTYFLAAGKLRAAAGMRTRFGEWSRLGTECSVFLRPRVLLFEELFITEVKDSGGIGDALIAHTDLLLMTERVYATLRTEHLDFTLGRDNVRWGPGRRGTLLISDAAPPMFLLSFRGRLGDVIQGEAFHGTLNAFEGRYIAGHRVEIRLAGTATLGLAEAARYDSPGIEPLYLIGIVPYALVEKLLYRDSTPEGKADHNQRNNVMQAIDLSWYPLRGMEIYGEFLADDVSTESSDMPSRIGYQLGAKTLWRVKPGLILLQGEYTRVWNYTYSVYYVRDFAHRGLPIGFVLGPDSEALSFWISLDTAKDRSFEIEADVSRKGEGTIGQAWCPSDYVSENCAACGKADASVLSGVVERTARLVARATWFPRDNFLASLGLGVTTVRSENHVQGKDRTYPVIEARLRARW
jgi:hypothetical protein